MPHSFYQDPGYKNKQSLITKRSWLLGQHDSLIKPLVKNFCQNPQCGKQYYIKPHYLQNRKYCSRRCAALVNNSKRTTSEETKLKLSRIMKGKHLKHPRPLLPRLEVICQNPSCKKTVLLPPWLARRQKYCSNSCAMKVIGGQTTSPKASKGKPGIRSDIDPNICFYSTWEANIARVFSLVSLKWQYAPKVFNLGKHTYRPDFYLPRHNTFIEVKNFMNPYSKERDKLFREKLPHLKLELILKPDYLKIKREYQPLIDNWE